MTRRILCFGDSLTWGWIATPEGAPARRYPYSERWTGIMAAKLGSDYEIIEEGLNARTTSIDDPVDPRLNGSAYLPTALAERVNVRVEELDDVDEVTITQVAEVPA